MSNVAWVGFELEHSANHPLGSFWKVRSLTPLGSSWNGRSFTPFLGSSFSGSLAAGGFALLQFGWFGHDRKPRMPGGPPVLSSQLLEMLLIYDFLSCSRGIGWRLNADGYLCKVFIFSMKFRELLTPRSVFGTSSNKNSRDRQGDHQPSQAELGVQPG